jgi:hypothetical protein
MEKMERGRCELAKKNGRNDEKGKKSQREPNQEVANGIELAAAVDGELAVRNNDNDC